MTIALPPELEEAVAEEASQKGTTVELLTLDILQERFLKHSSKLPSLNETKVRTRADFFAGYVGGLHSSEFVLGGAQLFQDTGQKFTDLLVKRRNEGKR